MGFLFLTIILILWGYSFTNIKISPFSILFMSLGIFYSQFTSINIDLIIKVLFLITSIIYLIKDKSSKKHVFSLLLIAVLILIESTSPSKFNQYYGLIDALTSFATFSTGILLFSIKFSLHERRSILKSISYLPIFSVLIGIPLAFGGFISMTARSGIALSGAALETNLSFFSVLSLVSLDILYQDTRSNKYQILKIINFILLCCTLTRGGIISGIIIILPSLLFLLKKGFKGVRQFIFLIITIFGSIYPLILLWKSISERTFTADGINTSGRYTAWDYIMNLITNKSQGMGLGSLKTLTEDINLRAFTAAHNTYIQFYYETGYLGVTLLSILFILILIIILKLTNYRKKIIYLTFISFLVYSYTDNCIVNNRYWYLFMFIIGCFKYFDRKEENALL